MYQHIALLMIILINKRYNQVNIVLDVHQPSSQNHFCICHQHVVLFVSKNRYVAIHGSQIGTVPIKYSYLQAGLGLGINTPSPEPNFGLYVYLPGIRHDIVVLQRNIIEFRRNHVIQSR